MSKVEFQYFIKTPSSISMSKPMTVSFRVLCTYYITYRFAPSRGAGKTPPLRNSQESKSGAAKNTRAAI